MILLHGVLDHELLYRLWKCHHRVVGGCESRLDRREEGEEFMGKTKPYKILQDGLWWPTLLKDEKEYVKSGDVC